MTDAWSRLRRTAAGGRFEALPHYDAESDAVTLFVSDEESKRERIDPHLTVYRSIRTGRVVGCHVKDVKSKLLERLKALHLGIETADMTLSLLLYAMPYAAAARRGRQSRVESRRYLEVAGPLARVAAKVRLPELVK